MEKGGEKYMSKEQLRRIMDLNNEGKPTTLPTAPQSQDHNASCTAGGSTGACGCGSCACGTGGGECGYRPEPNPTQK